MDCRRTIFIIAAVLSFAFGCGDTESKGGDSNSNNANNTNNIQASAAATNFCRTSPSVECNDGDFGFSFVNLPDCAERRTREAAECADVAIEDMTACHQAIDACEATPEELGELCANWFSCINRLENPNNVNNTNNLNNTNNAPEFTEEYLQVHSLIINSCAQAACHGSFSATYSYANGQLSSPAEVQEVLQSWTAVSGLALIEPGVPNASEIFVRLSREPGSPLLMPQTGKLPQEDIDLVRNWIAGGAVYTR